MAFPTTELKVVEVGSSIYVNLWLGSFECDGAIIERVCRLAASR